MKKIKWKKFQSHFLFKNKENLFPMYKEIFSLFCGNISCYGSIRLINIMRKQAYKYLFPHDLMIYICQIQG